MSKIKEAFQNGKAFIPFVTAGDPDLDTTKAIIKAMEEAGADIIEIGIPFSDPTAEGVVIQDANIRSLSGGTTTDKVFDMVRELRADGVKLPLVFMTYANVVFSYGTERFIKAMAEIGMNGLILPDTPFEEKGDFLPTCQEYGIEYISLIAPTSENRIAKIAADAEGFIYCVSSLGVTGTRSNITTDLNSIVGLIKESNPNVPVAIGFGISNANQVRAMSAIADGAIVGSAIVKIIAQHGKDAVPYVADFVKEMKAAQA